MNADVTPNEIMQKRFSQSFRGLNPEEVYDFLKQVASEFEEQLRHNLFLQDKIRQLEEAVQEYRNMEGTLKNTLVSSQKIGQEIKEEAKRKGNILIRESELEGERIIQKAKQRKERLEEETFQLLNQHKRFRAEFAAMVEGHHKMLQMQDARLMLEYDLKDPQDSPPAPKPEIEPDEEDQTEKLEVGEEEIKDLEILFPEERE